MCVICGRTIMQYCISKCCSANTGCTCAGYDAVIESEALHCTESLLAQVNY